MRRTLGHDRTRGTYDVGVTERRAVRLIDVAQQAGVTTSTASRALSRPEMVRPETRTRVEQAAKDLGYFPNAAARSLITGRTGVVAMVIPDLANTYYGVIAQSAQAAARRRDRDVFIVDTGFDPDREEAVVESVSRWADGVIVCTAQRRHAPTREGMPIVYVNRMVRGHHAVVVDPHWVLETQVDHLLELGHERILVACGPEGFWMSEVRNRHAERLASRIPALRLDPFRAPSFDGGRLIVDHLDSAVTAIAALTDRQAIGIVSRCTELGITIPEDLSIVGCDDVPSAAYVTPGLTTVRMPKEEIGRAAVSLLLDHLTEGGPVIAEQLTGDLVERASSAAPRTRASLRVAGTA